jgi:hypothetical protein
VQRFVTTGGSPFVACQRLFIHYIRGYPPCLEAVSSTHDPMLCHAVVTEPSLASTSLTDIFFTLNLGFFGPCIPPYKIQMDPTPYMNIGRHQKLLLALAELI